MMVLSLVLESRLQHLWILLPRMVLHGFGLHLNLAICEVFWPTGNQSFPELPPQIKRLKEVKCYGDHLLSCGHGPLRTRRHDALCEIVYHALLTDNKYVKREQRCSGNVDNRPGDVFHPDFSEGRAGFFDVTVRNSLLPTFITKAAINAGAAAEAAEASKDIHHEAHVVAAGGSFFPLVVWTPSSLNTLKSIASKISGVSNISFSQSYNNLMQQNCGLLMLK